MKKAPNIAVLLTLCAVGLSTALYTWSQDSISRQVSGSSNSGPSVFVSNDRDFLPVEKAYQVEVQITENQLIFDWSITDGYYLYQDGFKFNALDTSTQLQPALFENGVSKYDEYFEAELQVYYQQTRVTVPFTSTSSQIALQIVSQGCAEAGLCYPPHKQWLNADIARGIVDISTSPPLSTPAPLAASAEKLEAENLSLEFMLLLAFVGGIILNFMPCVFPVLSIKVLSFSRSHQSSRSRQIHSLSYTAGVVASFIVVALVMLSLRAAGQAIGWGFQLQSPLFVIGLIYLFFVMGLAFSGYLTLGSRLMAIGQGAKDNNSLTSSFTTGVLATTVASPCTAPFMAPALGYAITQPYHLALLVFTFLGLGMALPFILLACMPSLNQRLPKPGQWMDWFKQFLAFPLYITAVWLLWVAGRQTSLDVVVMVVIGLILIVMAIWLWKLDSAREVSMYQPTLSRLCIIACLAGAIALPMATISQTQKEPKWQAYSAQRLSRLRDAGKPVLLNLTADWCITCIVNERVALGSDEFYQALQDNQVTYLKGDWTHQDRQITQLLNRYQRGGVPLYLLYPATADEPEILPQILLPSTVIEALNRVKP